MFALVGALLVGCGASDSDRLANVKPIVDNAVLVFMTTQVSPPEVSGSTLQVQIALYPKDENRPRAQGLCRLIADDIAKKNAPKDYPNLIQIYGSNGNYWLQCEPS